LEVYALVGASGTGKSHRALWVAKERNIEYIIDDGLLIKGNEIIAGKSAKREKTRIGSIKTAVFTSDDHAFEVALQLKLRNAKSVLILGTSDNMVKRIAERLGLNKIDKTIYIEEISSKFEIQQALNTRKTEGKHVIPVPTLELKKDFSGFLLDPLNILRRKGIGDYESLGEKSVVRPTFSYLGKFTISDYTMYQLVEHIALKEEGVAKLGRFRAETSESGISLNIEFVLYYGYNIPELFKKLKARIIEEIERITSLNIDAIVLIAKSLVVKPKSKAN